jgi:uncharacterized coiled-coil DUF342 family protein
MTGAIGLAAGAAGFGLLAKNALEAGDALAKTASKLGVASDELFRFQTMAELSGVSTETANMALQRFTRRTAEAAMGTGEAKAALMELGIAADELQKLPLSERMKVLADAFVGVENESDQVRLAFKLFDSEGVSMINMLKNGSAGLGEMEARLGDLGSGMDDSIGNIEDFNDTMTILRARINAAMIEGIGMAAPQMEEFAKRAGEMAAPLVGDLLDGLSFLLENASTIATGIQAIVAAMVASKVIAFVTGVGQLTVALYGMATASTTVAAALAPVAALLAGAGAIGYGIGTLINNATGASDAIADWAAELTGLNDRIEAAKNGTDDLSDSAGGYTGEADDAAGETVNLKNKIEDLQEVVVTASKKDIPGITTSVVTLAKEERDAAKETLELKEALEKLRDKALKPQRDLDDFIKKMEELQKQIEAGGEGAEDAAKSMKVLVGEFTGVTDEAEDLRQEIARVKTAIESMGEVTDKNADLVDALNKKLEELGKELVDVTKESGSFTKSQREVLEEVKKTENELKALNEKLADLAALYKAGAISASEYEKAVKGVNEEIKELSSTNLSEFEKSVKDAFDTTPIGDFIDKIEGMTGTSGILDGLISGFGDVLQAQTEGFGTGQVTSFGDAIKKLFGGTDSPIGGLIDALSNLGISDFFSGVLGDLGSFAEKVKSILKDIAAAAIASVGINFLKSLIPGLSSGGAVPEFASGGRVFGRGGPREDRVPAMLSAGEYVIQASSVKKFGQPFMDAINAGMMPGIESMLPAFNLGGLISKWLAGVFAYGGPGYSIDNPDFMSYINALLNQFTQVDPRDNPDEAYEVAGEIVIGNIAKAISDAYAMADITFGTQIASGDSVADVIKRVLAPLGTLSQQDFLGEFNVLNADSTLDGIRDAFYDALFGYVNQIRAAPINFNVDDKYLALFKKANAVAGGSLYVQGNQFGGSLERGQASLVGEDGPELFVPDGRGRVSPIARDGGRELIEAVIEVKQEVAALRRQMDRQNPVQLFGGRSA